VAIGTVGSDSPLKKRRRRRRRRRRRGGRGRGRRGRGRSGQVARAPEVTLTAQSCNAAPTSVSLLQPCRCYFR